MLEFLTFVVVGLTAGSIYGLCAVGLVLTYKTSGIFNFAHGSAGAMAVFIFYFLHVEHGLAWPVAALITLGVFAPGDRLPSQRAIADDLGFHRNTVNAAFREAARRGLIRSNAGRAGTIVIDRQFVHTA